MAFEKQLVRARWRTGRIQSIKVKGLFHFTRAYLPSFFTLCFLCYRLVILALLTFTPGNTKGGSITVPLTSCLTGMDYSVLQIKTKIVSCHTAYPKPVKQEVNGTVILPPLVFPCLHPSLKSDVKATRSLLR